MESITEPSSRQEEGGHQTEATTSFNSRRLVEQAQRDIAEMKNKAETFRRRLEEVRQKEAYNKQWYPQYEQY